MNLKEKNSLRNKINNTKKNANRNNINCSCHYDCTKLLVPRNGTDVEERNNIEYIENL